MDFRFDKPQISKHVDLKIQNLRLSHKNIFKFFKKQFKKDDAIIMRERKFASASYYYAKENVYETVPPPDI